MAFTEDVVKNAFDRVNGYCQVCGKKLVYASRGSAQGRGGWEARHIKPVLEWGKDEVRNCMIVCMECYNAPAPVRSGERAPARVEGPRFGER